MNFLQRLMQGLAPKHPDPTGDPIRLAEVEAVLAQLRGPLRADGGDVRIVAEDDGWLELRFQGACSNCHASASTLNDWLEPRLHEALPWLRGLRGVA